MIEQGRAPGFWLGVAVTWFAAFNLRTGLIGVGPILPNLRDDLALSATQASFLVALPTAMIGLAAVPGGRMVDRLGARLVIGAGLVFVALGGGLRAVAPGYWLLILLTLLFGAGVGVAQAGMPRVARGIAPGRIGLATAVYSGGFFTGSVLSAFVTAPLLLPLTSNRTWRLPLLVWGALATLGLVAWLSSLSFWQLRAERVVTASRGLLRDADTDRRWSPWRDLDVWVVATVFLGQGVVYYLLIAWLPAAYDGLGMSEGVSGALFALFNLGTFPGMVGLPAVADRLGRRRTAVLIGSGATLIGVIGLAVAADAQPWQWIWPFLAGFGVGGLFSLGMVLTVDVAPAGDTGRVAGMVLAVGYLGSATGPVIGGVIRDLTGSFHTALAVLPAIGLVMVVLSFFTPETARRRTVLPVAAGSEENRA
ncbi:MAG TPA: MFS transporter [Thermomicrobiales bacterium]|nr:MFS transporter [Thermomicrobiales bacterium]